MLQERCPPICRPLAFMLAPLGLLGKESIWSRAYWSEVTTYTDGLHLERSTKERKRTQSVNLVVHLEV